MQFVLLKVICLTCTAAIVACATEPTSVVQPSAFRAVEALPAVVSGGSIEIDFMNVEFGGQLVTHAADGTVVPVKEVSATRTLDKYPEPKPFALAVDSTGHFHQVVPVMVCRWPSATEPELHQYAHWPTVTIVAPGCEPFVARFDETWVPHQLELTCRGAE